MKDKRFFAFGCSYTNFNWPTWADIIGINFSFYKNYGKGGACNLYILQQFLEANETYKFNKDDLVIVMLTEYDRFTYITDKRVQCRGNFTRWISQSKDIEARHILVSGLWTNDLAVTNSYIAVRTMKDLLQNINCEYKILFGIDNSEFIKNTNGFYQTHHALTLAKKIYSILDEKLSMDEWIKFRYKHTEYYKFWDRNHVDLHPTIQMHEEYVKEYFPEYYTTLSQQFVESETKELILTDINVQAHEYSVRQSKFLNCNSTNTKLKE